MIKPLLHSRFIHIILITGMMLIMLMPTLSYCGSYLSQCQMQEKVASKCCPTHLPSTKAADIPVLIETQSPADCHHSISNTTNECTLCNCSISQSAFENSFVFTINQQHDSIAIFHFLSAFSFPSFTQSISVNTVSNAEILRDSSLAPAYIRFCSYLI